MTSRPQHSKRERGRERAQRGFFDGCPARRETVAELGECPLCGAGPNAHELEPGPVADDAGLGEWALNLPKGQA